MGQTEGTPPAAYRVPTAEQGPGADCLQPPLRSGFRQQLRPGVRPRVRPERKQDILVETELPIRRLLWLSYRGKMHC
jgi:hypothetical protein